MKEKKVSNAWYLAGILIVIVISLVGFLVYQNYQNKDIKEEKEFYWDVDLDNISCSSNYDCKDTNQICDSNVWKCVDADVNLKGQVLIGLEEDCLNLGGD